MGGVFAGDYCGNQGQRIIGGGNDTLAPGTWVFGNQTDVLAEIIRRRFDLWEGVDHNFITNVTTNLTIPQLHQRYGAPLLDRLLTMCELVEFTGVSYRQRAVEERFWMDLERRKQDEEKKAKRRAEIKKGGLMSPEYLASETVQERMERIRALCCKKDTDPSPPS